MSTWLAGKSQKLALFLVISSLVGALGWLYRSAKSSKTNFLPTISGAEWIIYPKAPEGRIHPHLELATVFRRSFVLNEVPAQTELRICAFHRYSLLLNGRELEKPPHDSWKNPDRFSISDGLHPGTNEILVTVFNTNGPPALWLSLKAGNFALKSDESWQTSYAGAAWKNAQLAKMPLRIPAGNGLYGGEKPGPAFQKRWPALLLLALVSASIAFASSRFNKANTEPVSKLREWLPVGILAVLWIGLFANNLPVLSASVGYDVTGHREYIDYVETQWSPPLASDGWEMFQPPLYYFICAVLLKIFFLTVHDFAAAVVLRIFGLVTGITHFIIVWKSLRLLFPESKARQNWGLLLAASLPPAIFLSHYVSNEALAAALVSGCVYMTLRILKQEQPSWKIFLGLGLGLSIALLTKSTAVLALPPIFGALAWKATKRRASIQQEVSTQKAVLWTSDLMKILLVFAVAAMVAGWHYLRTWYHYGSPIVGVWEPRTGFFWWQDDGLRTATFYVRFGDALFHPWFSTLHSFADGFYSTLWGDGLLGGSDSLSGPPWNFDFMALGYWLALVPTLGVIVGAFLSFRQFLRRPSPEWLLLFGLSFLIAWAIAYMSITIPYYCVVKAFYGFSGLIPFCAFGAWGFERMTSRAASQLNEQRSSINLMVHRFKAVAVSALIVMWALSSFASFWIIHSSVPTLLGRVAYLRRENRPLDAQHLLEQRLTAEPENQQVRAELANVLVVTKDEERAVKEATLASEADPNDYSRLATLAMALARKDPDRAIELARRAIKIAPGFVLAYQQLAVLLLAKENFAEVEQIARDGLSLEPFHPIFHQALGESLLHRHELAESTSQLKLACALGPQNSWAHCLLAQAYELQHQTSEAISEYATVLQLQPDFPAALNNLAWLRATLSDEQFRDGPEAVRLAERACQITDYKEPMYVGTLAAAYAEAGRLDDAVKAATKARDLARANQQQELVEKNEELMKLFAARKPYRQPEK